MPHRARWLLLAAALLPAFASAQAISITGGAPAVQDFGSLAASGTGTTLPAGWYSAETGSNANATYTAGTGASNSGDTYSFGASGSAERALGGIQSGSLIPQFGAQLRNDTGATLTQVAVAYTGEQWRLGAAGRIDRLDVQYSLDATSLTTGTWVDVDTLDFTAPITAGVASALDGNAVANRIAVSATISGLSLAPSATLWVRWVDFNASGADDGLAIDDVSFSSGAPPVDTPPAVAATTPANNATGVAPAANLSVTFSEPVTLGATVLELACTTGPRSVARTGGPTTWTFDPTTDFAPGDACTATVRAAQVTDLDGTPDAMAADLVFGFSVAPDLPPSVVSTVPANNANNVGLASNLVVTFSEPVNAGTGAFELRCPPSAPVPFTLSQVAQTTYTLDPQANFDPLASCSLRVVAAQVTDLDGNADPLPADVVVAFTTGQGAGSYYASVDASSCQALRTSLHALIDDHTAFPYTATTTDTWDILEAADQDPLDPSRVLEIYENVSHPKAGGGNNDYNREHTWPNAYGFNNLGGVDAQGRPVSAAYTDTHMLMLSDITYNSDRGSKPFADCPQASGCSVRATQAYNGVGGGPVVYPGNHNWVVSGPNGEREGSFEVWNARKGDVARAILYMDVRYEGGTHGITGQPEPDLIVTNDRAALQTTPGGSFAATGYMGLRSTLLAWSAADPPTALEVLRNDIVQSFQGNRNPFTDRPEWVAIAFADPCNGGAPDAVFGNGFEP